MQRRDTVVCSKLMNTLAGKIVMEWIQRWMYLTAIEIISKKCFCRHINIMNSSIVTWKVYCGCSIQAYSNYKNMCWPTLHGVAMVRQEYYWQHIHIVSSSLAASKVKCSRAIENSSNYNNTCTTSTNAPTTYVQPALTRWQVWLCVENSTAKFCPRTRSLVNLSWNP